MMAKLPLIIIPGWSGGSLLWQHQIKYLCDVCDEPQVHIANGSNIFDMADALLARLPKTFHLVGHSLGGWLSQKIAARSPERVASMTLVASWSGISSAEQVNFYRYMLKCIEDNKREQLIDEVLPSLVDPLRQDDAKLLEDIRKGMLQISDDILLRQTQTEIEGESTTDCLHRISTPTLIIAAREDPFFDISVQKGLQNKIKSSKLAIIDNCGHMPSIERPQTLTSLIRLWVSLHA